MSEPQTPSSSSAIAHDDSVYADDELNASSSSSSVTYLHHMGSAPVDHNVVSSTQHHQQPFKHILAQKYAAESTSEQSESSDHTHMQHLTQFYAYSPLVSSSCNSSHYESHVLDTGHGHSEVVHVESTSDPLDSEESILIRNTAFHNNVIDHLIKPEQISVTNAAVMNSTALVSSTSAANNCRSDIIFECANETVDSTTNGQHHLSYVPYDDNKMPLGEMILPNEDYHSLSPSSPNFLPQNSGDLLDQRLDYHCKAPLSQTLGNSREHETSQENVINDLPVLSRARASLPSTYLYVKDIDPSNSVCGVFAKKTIPKRTQFGPVEGVIVEHINGQVQNNKHNLIIFVTESLILDQSDENQSNWMKFVRAANTYDEQNLVLVSKEQIMGENEVEMKFFFMTNRPISAKEELKVWYSKEYGEKFHLRVLEPFVQFSDDTQETSNFKKRTVASLASEIPTAGGHKLRNKIAKTQQQQLQRNENIEKLSNDKQTSTIGEEKKENAPSKYQCDTCQKVFPRFYSLRRHQIMHSGEKKYKCPLCGMSFSHVYNRNRHVKRHAKVKRMNQNNNASANDTGNSLRILKLPKTDDSRKDQKNDNNINDNLIESTNLEYNKVSDYSTPIEKPQILIVAKKSAPKSDSKSQPQKTVKPYRCHECYKSFTTDDRLLRHAIVHSSDEGVKPLACQFCQKRFLNNSALSCHLKIHFTPKDQPRRYDCVICKEWFDSTQARKDHVVTHADPIRGYYTCPSCSKHFEEFSAVRKHIRAFHSDKQYPCTQCEKVFPRPDKLKLHMLRHSDHREFLCANCGKQFKRKDKLKEHMQRMHAPDREAKIAAKQAAKLAQQQSQHHKKFVPKVSPTDYHRFIYKCHTCLLGFKRRGMLVNHLAKRHPDISPETVPELNLPILKTTRDYYCQYCEKIYKSSSKRKAHILKNHPGKSLPLSNRHKGGIPVIPGMPNPTYSATVGSITTHPHYCDWCHKQYASKAKLLQHQRKKHPEQMAIINSNARSRQRAAAGAADAISAANMVANTPISLGNSVTATNLITILASSTDLQELLQSSSATNDLLTQAMSELTATSQCKGDGTATLIITAQPTDPNWNHVCEEITGTQ